MLFFQKKKNDLTANFMEKSNNPEVELKTTFQSIHSKNARVRGFVDYQSRVFPPASSQNKNFGFFVENRSNLST